MFDALLERPQPSRKPERRSYGPVRFRLLRRAWTRIKHVFWECVPNIRCRWWAYRHLGTPLHVLLFTRMRPLSVHPTGGSSK
jgi:hypothetical protein